MAELSIRLVRDPDSGQMQIRIGLVSDEDDTPQEHERRHRRLLLGLLPGLPLESCEESAVRVERERPAREPVVG
jgi:hypothetical protein